jgi:hypothetical protein
MALKCCLAVSFYEFYRLIDCDIFMSDCITSYGNTIHEYGNGVGKPGYLPIRCYAWDSAGWAAERVYVPRRREIFFARVEHLIHTEILLTVPGFVRLA